jgi:aldehyde:ferredoxin oxidoreductase
MAEQISGTSNKVLEVDLTSKTWSIYEVSREERKLYIGAKGLGLKLLFDRMKPGVDPLGEENMIAVMPGILMGTNGVCSGRFHAVSKSPLTNIFNTSSCGGPFGMQLKTAGWDGVIIKGRSKTHTILKIDKNGAYFEEGEHFWGLDTQKVQEKLLKDNKEAALVIGPAGENGVKFANIASGHRFLGRGGLGAVMGSKNLKGVVVKGGDYKIVPVHKKKFNRWRKRGQRYINQNEMSSYLLRNFGTNANLNLNNNANILPVKNFTSGRHDDAHKISGETIKELHDTSFSTCKPCAILCGHKGNFKGKKVSVPEFESVSLLGSNLNIFDSNIISEFNEICSKMGMDTISAGGTLAWIMEASEKGIFESDLKFGSSQGIEDFLYDIAYVRGKGAEAALGSRALSKKYGGEDFAIQVKGMEMAAYDPRGAFGHGLGYAVANRGACHLSAYVVALEVFFGLLKPDSIRAKADFVKFFEDLTCGINSLQTCQFTMYSYTLEPLLSKYTPNFILNLLMMNIPKLAISLIDFSLYSKLFTSVTGIKMSMWEFRKAGERIHMLERYMNTREGISKKDDTLPKRMLEEGLDTDKNKRVVPLEKMLLSYYRKRGYDSNGIPLKSKLKKLKIVS